MASKQDKIVQKHSAKQALQQKLLGSGLLGAVAHGEAEVGAAGRRAALAAHLWAAFAAHLWAALVVGEAVALHAPGKAVHLFLSRLWISCHFVQKLTDSTS